MANCVTCGKEIRAWEMIGDSRCEACHARSKRQKEDKDKKAAIQNFESIVLSTETVLDGVRVTQRLGVITAEVAYGMNVFKDLFAGIRNIVGGRSEAIQKTMRDARETVLMELKKGAAERGANAVIAIDLDYQQIGDG